MIDIIIADDHAIVRQGLKKMLAEESDIKVIGESSSADETVRLIRKQRCSVLLLDVTMPGKSGLDIIKELKQIAPAMHILVLSMHPEAQFAVRVFRAGGSGYLTKESAPDELVRAIRKVAIGGKYVSATLAELLASLTEEHTDRMPHERLSEREFQIMRMLAKGTTVSDIANDLSISVKTVSTYRSRVLDKMNVRSNAELARYAVEHRIID